MNKAIQAAQKAARKAIEGTYTGLLKVTEYQSVKDPVTHITRTEKVVVLENQPCKLSFETITTAIQTEAADHKGWVPGKFIMTKAEAEIQALAPKVLETKIKKYLEKAFS